MTEIPGRAPLHRRPGVIAIAAVMVAGIVQISLASRGTWHRLAQPGPQATYDYSRMAEGFLHGQLSLRIMPRPALLALADPYDPNADAPYALRDAALFNGRYYYYLGSVPVLPLTGACAVLGISQPQVEDQYVGFPFLLGLGAVTAGLIFQVRRRLVADQPGGAAAMGALSLGLGMPMLYIAVSLGANQTAIVAGQFFLIGGVWAAWRGIEDIGQSPRKGWLVIAGTCWALAAGSRVSLPPALAVMAGITLLYLWRRGRNYGAIFSLLAPLAAGAVILGWYNFARFHSVTEFGLRYQLTGRNQTDLTATGMFAAHNVVPNLLLYLFRPPGRWHTFPYLVAMGGRPWLRQFMPISAYVVSEPMVGLAWTQPFLIFAVLGAVGGSLTRESAAAGWLRLCLGAGLILGIAPPLMMDYSATRYLLDGVPCATVLAATGYMAAVEWMRRRGRNPWAVAGLLIAGQAVVGVLLALGNHPQSLTKAMAWFPRL